MVSKDVEESSLDDLSDDQVAQFKEEAQVAGVPDLKLLTTVEDSDASDVIVAEGDSWFDYLPGTDVIDCLRRFHGHVIDKHASPGDTLENMIYGTKIDDEFRRVRPTIETVLRRVRQIKPKIFLFSGGGNDIAGDEFESYLNHHDSGLAPVREDFLDHVINVVFREYYQDLISKILAASSATHIIAHGYGHTRPTGRGVNFLFFTFAGPWLRSALARKGIFDQSEQRRAVELVVNKYNDMLADLAATHQSGQFHHVDLRSEIDPDTDWANELHLKNSAFARVSRILHSRIESLS